MRVLILIAVSFLWAFPTVGEEGLSFPWEEFKTLYREHVEKEFRERTAPLEKEPFLYSIDSAQYRLSLGEGDVRCEATISGKAISGTPEPIVLFGQGIALAEMGPTEDASVLCLPGDSRLHLLPVKDSEGFQLSLSFLVQPSDENGVRSLSIEIPHALRNMLELSVPAGVRLLEAPGMAGEDGIYRFPAAPTLSLKYAVSGVAGEEQLPDIGVFSRIHVQARRLVLSTGFLPSRSTPERVTLRAPQGAKLLGSTLGAPRIEPLEEGRYALQIPVGENRFFNMDFALDLPQEEGPLTFMLPAIEGNQGRQGRFSVEEPDDAQVVVTGSGLVTQIPIERLGEGWASTAAGSLFFMTAPVEESISLTLKRFQAVATPAAVLECQYFFAVFEENGNVLSVLTLDVPPEAGSRLSLPAVPDSEVWSLTVNNKKKPVYAGGEDSWIIPLDVSKASHVELKLLRKGEKMGLQGRLEAVIPKTGLPSRRLCVGVSLPSRIEVLSVEGPVSPAASDGWPLPPEFSGKPSFFSSAFSQGEEIRLAIAYKEPVQPVQPVQANKGNEP